MNRHFLFVGALAAFFGCLLQVPLLAGQGGHAGKAAAAWLEADGATMDWFGTRSLLEDRGISFSGSFTADFWGNTCGGIRTGAAYNGILEFGTTVDLGKLVAWKGASVSTTWLWLSGQDASTDLVGNLMTISNLAGFDTFRNLELWFQQTLWDEKVSLRVGQLAADSEFVISDYGALFINSAFGWPPFMFLNLPSGGPALPISTLGTRLTLSPVSWFTFQSAAFQGNVYAQNVNRHGFRWSLNSRNGFTFFNEAQFRWNHSDNENGLPGQFKAGAWAQTGSLADPLTASTTSGNFGLYGILDLMLFRESQESPAAPDGKSSKNPPSPAKSDQGLGWFGRAAFAPADRNFNNFYFDTGISYKGLLPSRNEDILGLAFAYTQISNGERASLASAGSSPVGAEILLEFTYQTQITPWLSLQPDLQFIINPGSTTNYNNSLVIGARAAVTF